MIVLACQYTFCFPLLAFRNTILGLVLIYPVTTIPVALYGYFRGLPYEIEEAGLMDGFSSRSYLEDNTTTRASALASVSLYVFMIAWNEFLLAFMLLDDPLTFTLTRELLRLTRQKSHGNI